MSPLQHLTAPVILASASPRRAELLRAAGITFEVRPAAVDEAERPGESPEAYVTRLAVEKADAVRQLEPARLVLAADTTVVVDGGILGKPADAEDAKRMLRLLASRQHDVVTGVALAAPDRPATTAVATTVVVFGPLTPDEIDWYVSTGEPMDKAGAYGIQGLASRFITRIEGSYSNVVGLPVELVYRMLEASGSSRP